MAKRKIIVAEFAVTAYSDGSIDWDRFDQFFRRALVRAGLLRRKERPDQFARGSKNRGKAWA